LTILWRHIPGCCLKAFLLLASLSNSYRCKDPLAPDGSWLVFSHYYVGENDPTQPLISPLYGDLADLPPLLLYVGEEESMLDDSTQFAKKARNAGVNVRLQVGKGMVHCYPALSPLFPEAREAMEDICAFLRTNTAAQRRGTDA
jgi:acetyl esterase/lipase